MITYATNKKAKFNYEILDTFEAGLVLNGGEVKSIRAGRCSMKESYIKIKNGEMWLTQAHIPVPDYIPNFARFDEKRDRKVLMHKKEIIKLKSKIDEKGLTLIAISVYQPDSSKKIKIKIALARGKKTFDKKQTIKERDIKRDMDRTIRNKDFN